MVTTATRTLEILTTLVNSLFRRPHQGNHFCLIMFYRTIEVLQLVVVIHGSKVVRFYAKVARVHVDSTQRVARAIFAEV